MAKLDTAFWHGDFGFLIDPSPHAVAPATDGQAFRDDAVAERLESSGHLPDLDRAPVASWLLPRLVEATRGGIRLDDRERLRNDGGCVALRWVAFTASLKPRAFFSTLCYANRIVAQGDCVAGTGPADLVTAFLTPLLADPRAVRRWQVSVTDTDPPDGASRFGPIYIFGWDGTRYLGTRDYE